MALPTRLGLTTQTRRFCAPARGLNSRLVVPGRTVAACRCWRSPASSCRRRCQTLVCLSVSLRFQTGLCLIVLLSSPIAWNWIRRQSPSRHSRRCYYQSYCCILPILRYLNWTKVHRYPPWLQLPPRGGAIERSSLSIADSILASCVYFAAFEDFLWSLANPSASLGPNYPPREIVIVFEKLIP